ncbi:kinetochore protein spc24 [Cordyceps fumosorosea ARSEF 2679]|uniref:Kinetochore protein Spc24 n=1 Tax=Cordyceps fumosorosea (strain ARSEF 2679) TaxID=1081104 RepID=A0A168ANM4_CORFA|nr:kinetochore protein spc24 [Cordyceps fumosorosea ARSEF 2679]OAA68985.1 kinetochore protein spc24 [Cordyceps fumosorosea ARSEF 2679]
MLLAEDPATLIRHTIDNFNIGPDKAAVERVDESLSTLGQARDLRLREASSSLQRLARQLSAVSQRHRELLDAHDSPAAAAASSEHAAALDSEKFRTAKAASDAEAEAERAALKAADLAARLQELELQGVEGDVGQGGGGAARRDLVDDEVLLRLKVYRSLGIDVERDGDGEAGGGEWTRAVIRNERKGDVHVVNIEKKFSRFFYANYFWKTL